MNKEILDSFVELMAVGFEVSDEWLSKWLEIYYQIRRAKEDAEKELRLLIHPTTDAAQLREEVERAARRSPEDEFISKAAAPEEPPEEVQVTQDAFEPVPPPVPTRGTAAAKFKRDVRDRLEALRKKNVPLQSIIDASGGAVSMSEILDVLQCAKVDYSVYKELDAALKRFPET